MPHVGTTSYNTLEYEQIFSLHRMGIKINTRITLGCGQIFPSTTRVLKIIDQSENPVGSRKKIFENFESYLCYLER